MGQQLCRATAVVGLIYAACAGAGTGEPADGMCTPMRINVDGLEPGEVKRVIWGPAVVKVYHRTPADFEYEETDGHSLSRIDRVQLRPSRWSSRFRITSAPWAKVRSRSIDPNYFVFWGVSPVFGCEVLHVPASLLSPPENWEYLGAGWAGGFLDPCYRVGFDYAGHVTYLPPDLDPRVVQDSRNSLVVPPYEVKGDGSIVLHCRDRF